MKKIFITLSLLSNLFFYSHMANAAEQSLDQMVAIVNDDLITRSELDRELKATKMQMTQQSNNLPASEAELKKLALNQLINKKLQLQLASQAGITISDQDVDKAIKTIASKNNVSVDELFVHVKQEGMSPDSYRTEIHDQIVMQKLQQHEIAGKVNVTPEEINAFMKSSGSQVSGDSEYRIEDILIPTSDTPSAQELSTAKARAESIVQKLQSGVVFSKIADEQAKGAAALQDNDLGYRKLAELPSAFADTVAGMKKNGVAGPIQTGNGLHILHMTDLRSTNAANPLSDRKTVEAMLLQQKFEQAMQTWVAKLRSAAFITEAV